MMGNNRSHWALRQIAEQEAPANSIDLWARLQARLAMSKNAPRHLGDQFKLKGVAFAGIVLLLLVALIAFVPEVQAFAEEVIQRMGIAFVDTQHFDEQVEVAKVEATRVTPPPSLSPEEIRQRVPFPLRLPYRLPEGLVYVHGSIVEYDPNTLPGSGKQVSITYARTADLDFEKGALVFRANDGPIGAPPLLAETRQQMVEVNGQPGIYVHGGWRDDGGGDPNTQMGPLQWDDQIDNAYLTWTQDGVTYLLEAYNLGLNLEGLLQIAKSMVEQ